MAIGINPIQGQGMSLQQSNSIDSARQTAEMNLMGIQAKIEDGNLDAATLMAFQAGVQMWTVSTQMQSSLIKVTGDTLKQVAINSGS